jgi:hypothetical protein
MLLTQLLLYLSNHLRPAPLLQVLRPHQVVSIVPGCLCISRKTSLVRTLLNCYGPELAFRLLPRTFKLPDELDAWADWLAAHPEQVGACVEQSYGCMAEYLAGTTCRQFWVGWADWLAAHPEQVGALLPCCVSRRVRQGYGVLLAGATCGHF